MKSDIQCVVDAQALLGEGLCWDSKAQCLWWLDIYSKVIFRYDPSRGHTDSFRTPQPPGCLAVRERGGLVVAMGDGFHAFDPKTGKFQHLIDAEAHVPETRMNDGKTDRQGRFWGGTMFEVEGKTWQPLGALYRLDADLSCHKVIPGVTCSNGLAWSPDSRTMYFTDSGTPYVWAFDFDPASGEVANRRVFVDLSSMNAIGDGATVDAEGGYWLTLPFKGKVHRYDPAGKLVRSIDLPTDLPTCCEFGGKDLDVLYISTATFKRSAKELEGQSHAGGLFAIEPGVKGLEARPFVG